MPAKKDTTWDALAFSLDVSSRELHRWRNHPDAPDGKELKPWAEFLATRRKRTQTAINHRSVSDEQRSQLQNAFDRIRHAEARIKEARAHKDEIANAKSAGSLIDAELASTWCSKVLAAVRIEADSLAAHLELMGLPPEVSEPAKSALIDMARRFRNRVASIPQIVAPPKPKESA